MNRDTIIRLANDEFYYLIKKYPQVAFNLRRDRPDPLGRKGTANSKEFGFNHLVILEPYITIPEQWDVNVVSQFDSIVTYNRKFAEMCKGKVKTSVISGCTFMNNRYDLDSFVPYEEKIKGVCCINSMYHTGKEGDIVYLRERVMQSLNIEPYLVKHIYGPKPWGGKYYQGPGGGRPSHIDALRLMNLYLFRLCFESTYHPMWNWDFMTERLLDCFKTKTVPIYFGCYNIEQHVPKALFIDFRDFKSDMELSEYLLSFPKNKYIEMTEAAYEWVKTSKLGSVEDLEIILKELG